MTDSSPVYVWIVEFTEGVVEDQRRKLFVTDIPAAQGVASMVLRSFPMTSFTVYGVDAAMMTFPTQPPPADFIYQSTNVRVDQEGQEIVPEINDEEGFDDTDSERITFKPPGVL